MCPALSLSLSSLAGKQRSWPLSALKGVSLLSAYFVSSVACYSVRTFAGKKIFDSLLTGERIWTCLELIKQL
jgi:F0F1-type ATP synthase assembly protein I